MALTPAPNEQIADVDYEVILSTIMETVRGRRFLGEYLRRARQSELQPVLTEVAKLKRNHSDNPFDFTALRPRKTPL